MLINDLFPVLKKYEGYFPKSELHSSVKPWLPHKTAVYQIIKVSLHYNNFCELLSTYYFEGSVISSITHRELKLLY